MPFAELRGHRFWYEDSGGRGDAVLFSHGFVLDHSMWDAQVDALSDDHRCITWDARGHGMSDCHGPFDFWDAADDAVALLDHLGVERACFVGLSQGGFLAMRAALRHPERVHGLVLIDTAAAVFDPETLAGYRAMQERWISEGPVGELAEAMASLLFGPGYDASVWLAKWQAKPPQDHREPWNTVLGRDDVLARLGEIGCPSLVIHGGDDRGFDVATAVGLRDALADCAGLVVIEGAAHVPPVTHPHPVHEALRRFLARL